MLLQEAILLDLLRVISHHRARLATPIRTVQKIYSDADLENVPFADSIYSQGVASKRPFLLIEPPYKINGEDKSKGRSQRTNGERDGKTTLRPASDSKTDSKDGALSVSDPKVKETASDTQSEVKKGETSNHQNMGSKAAMPSNSDPTKSEEVMVKETLQSDSKMNNKATEVSNARSNVQQKSSASDGSNQKTESMQSKKSSLAGNFTQSSSNTPSHMSSEIGAEKAGGFSTSSQVKQGERTPAPQPSTSRPVLEDNIVLGVALEGSKRTLPIEEELSSQHNGQGSQNVNRDKKNGKNPASPSSTSAE